MIFVAGTDFGSGKTTLAAALVRRLRALEVRAIGIKPIATGCTHGEDHDLVPPDAERLRVASTPPRLPLDVVAPYRFPERLEPALAAEVSGLELTLADLAAAIDSARGFGDLVVIEGAGGALSALAADGLGLDLAQRLGATLLIAAKDEPGAPSQTLLIIEAARRRELPIAGVVLVQVAPAAPTPEILLEHSNAALIRARGGVRVFGPLPHVPVEPGADGHPAIAAAAEAFLTSEGLAEAVLESLRSPSRPK